MSDSSIVESLIEDHPHLSKNEIGACVDYAKAVITNDEVISFRHGNNQFKYLM